MLVSVEFGEAEDQHCNVTHKEHIFIFQIIQSQDSCVKYPGDVFSYVIVFPVFTITFLSELSLGIKRIEFFELDTLF